jgi:hypothetical protein
VIPAGCRRGLTDRPGWRSYSRGPAASTLQSPPSTRPTAAPRTSEQDCPCCPRRRRWATWSAPELGGWALVARVPAPDRARQPGSARDRCTCSTVQRGACRPDQRRGAHLPSSGWRLQLWLPHTGVGGPGEVPDHATPSGSAHPAQLRSWRGPLLPLQNGDPTVRAISAQPTRSGVSLTSPSDYSHIDLVIARVDGKLLAYDLQCGGGGPDTSVYREPLTGR